MGIGDWGEHVRVNIVVEGIPRIEVGNEAVLFNYSPAIGIVVDDTAANNISYDTL